MADEEDKAGGDALHINVKVKDGSGNEIFFKIKKKTPFQKMMTAYCSRVSADPATIAFLFDGARLRGDQTPEMLDMEDGDEIDAMLHQTGGC